MKKLVVVILFSFLFNSFLIGQEKSDFSPLTWISEIQTEGEKFYENGTRICYLNIYGEIPEDYVESIVDQVLTNSDVLRFHLYYGKQYSRCMCETSDDFTNEQLAIILDEIIDKYYDSREYLNNNYDAIIEKVSNNQTYVKKNGVASHPPVVNDDFEPTLTNYGAKTGSPPTGENCNSSIAFCTDDNYLFPASTNVSSLGYLGCLNTTPNPAWYYMQIGQSGDIIIDITSGYDVDFVAWGPFYSVETYCSEIPMTSCSTCPNNTSNPSFYPYGKIVDCSYSTAASETVHIYNAQEGEIYALLITNYANQITNISFHQTSGSGRADCSIVAPPISSNSDVCEGSTLELYVTYAQPGATYQWSGPGGWTSNQMNPTRPNATTAMSGTYSLVVTIGSTSSEPITTEVNVVPYSTPTFNAVGPYCPGDPIPALPTTSLEGITGAWSPAINNTATTVYTFTPDPGQCANSTTLTITVTPGVTPTFDAVGPYCQGATIPALPTSSTNGITGAWSPAINNTATTTYTFTPTDGQCASDANMQIVINSLPTPSINPDPAFVCSGDSIQLTASGGTAYAWSNSSNSSSIIVSPTTMTAYTVTVTDAQNCSASTSRIVNVNPLPTVTTTVDCSLGASQGVINVTSPIGANYQYSINGGGFQSSPSFGALANGSYAIIVSNTTTGCSSPESVITVDCGCTNPPTVTLAGTSAEVCGTSSSYTLSGNTFGGSATAVTLSHNGGGSLDITSATSSPFSFTYTPVASDLGNTVAITVTTNNPIGTPCDVEQQTFNLSILTLPSVVVAYNTPVCETGTLSLSETGGAAINWSWSGPNSFSSTLQNPQINNATSLVNGTYHVTITDGNSCTNSGSVLVSISPNPVANATFAPIACNGGTTIVTVSASGGTEPYSGTGTYTVNEGSYSYTVTDAHGCVATTSVNLAEPPVLTSSITAQTNQFCSTPGSATVLGSGGTPSYTYQWPAGAGGVTGGTASMLPAGTYYVTVRDANLCSTVQSITIIDEGSISATATVNNNISCYGGKDGRINISIPSGTPIYSINWNSGSTTTSSSNYTITDLTAGPYTITVSDANSCQIVLNATITEPALLQASSSVATIPCYGDTTTVVISATGGTGSYTGTGNFTVTSGTYSYTVTDANSCLDTVIVMVVSPAPIEASYVFENPSCIGARDGYIELSVVGGVEPYLFETNNIIIDIPLLSGLSAGNYDVIITDANNCSFKFKNIILSESNINCLRIPNAFTPNGDGINETWIIENIEFFSGAKIYVYNRWGQEVWVGYPGDEWDGKRNSKLMPAGSYLYVIELYDGSTPYTGTVTLVY